MHYEITSDDHRSAIDTTARIVTTTSRLPILSNIRIEAEESGKIRYIATDLDTTITVRAQGTVKKAGVACLPAKKLQEIAAQTGDGTITLKNSGENVAISFGSTRFKIMGASPEEWPAPQPISPNGSFHMKGSELAAMIEKSVFAVSSDEARGLLQGLLWEMNESGMRMVGCDGYRMAIVDRPGLPKGTAGTQFVLPRRGAALIQKTVAGAEAVDVVLTAERAAFAIPGIQIVTSLLAGRFPDYRAVMPKKHTRTVETELASFTQAVRRVAVLANKNSPRICFDFQAPMTRLWTQGTDVGTSEDELPSDYTGEPLRMDLNAKQLLDVLGRMDAERVRIQLTQSSESAVIRSANEDTTEAFMLMPLIIKG